MFLFNSLCCISDQTNHNLSPKTKFIKKANLDPINIQHNISQSDISDNNSQNLKGALYSTAQERIPTFPKSLNGNQSLKSDECYIGSDHCSLEDEVQDEYVSPVEYKKVEDTHKLSNNVSTKNHTFYDWDLADTEVKQWSIKDVLKFLAKIGLKGYHTIFYQNKIKGKDLVTLTEIQLKEDLSMKQQDARTISMYIQLLKQKSQRQAKHKSLSRTFGGHRTSVSLYKYHRNTYFCRKILHLVKNPIMQEQGQQQNGQNYGRKQNYTTKDVFSTDHYSELMTN